jgi:hypothetical protein
MRGLLELLELLALIILVGLHVLVESIMHDLGSFASPAVSELGGGKAGENPFAHVVQGPYLIHEHPRQR